MRFKDVREKVTVTEKCPLDREKEEHKRLIDSLPNEMSIRNFKTFMLPDEIIIK